MGAGILETSTFIVEIAKHSSWPIVIISSVFLLRHNIQTLLLSLKSAEHGKIKIQFHEPPQLNANKNDLVTQSEDNPLPDGMTLPPDITDMRDDVISKINLQLATQNNSDKISILTKHLAALQLTASYEKIYYQIFGSQIRLLEYLNSLPEKKSDSSEIEQFYIDTKTVNPEYFGASDFTQYMEFLISWGLVTTNSKKCLITKAGIGFLKHITALKFNKNKIF